MTSYLFVNNVSHHSGHKLPDRCDPHCTTCLSSDWLTLSCFCRTDLWVKDVLRLSAHQPTPHLSLTCKPGEASTDNPELCNSILSPTITSSCLLIFLSSFSSPPLISIAAFSHANHFIPPLPPPLPPHLLLLC